MIKGFSSNFIYYTKTSSIDGGLEFPFNIPNALEIFLYEDLDCSFDSKMEDLKNLLKFTYESRKTVLDKIYKDEVRLKKIMLNGDDSSKDKYDDLQHQKYEISQDFKDLVEVVSSQLNSDQCNAILKKVGVDI